MALDIELKRTERVALRPVRRKVQRVSKANTETSQQTLWMLAVRDQRDRQAFSHLFDYFAPRLKGFIMRSGMPSQLKRSCRM